MISIKAAKPAESQLPDAAQIYRKVHAEAPPARRWPSVVALAVTAVALYLKSLFPGQAKTDAAAPPAEKDEASAGDATLKPSLAESDQPAPEPGDVDETGALGQEPAAPKAVGSGGPGAPVGGLPDFLNIDSRLIDYDQLPLPRYPSPIFDPAAGLSANNDNGSRNFSLSSVAGGGSDGGPRSAGHDEGTQPNGPQPGGDDDEEEPQEPRNRAPRVSGPVQLSDIGGCQALMIASLALLAGATDADADTLSIFGVQASHGRLTATEGGWVFKPDPGWLGTVTLSYWIGDGEAYVRQTATLRVLEFLDVIGTPGDDMLLGSECADRIEGRGGADLIDARGGNDIVVTGSGDDHIVGGAGNDRIDAGAGDDIVFGGAGNDVIHGGAGNDSLHGGDGDDTIFGGAGNDVITGSNGNDIIDAGPGDDVVDAGPGDNTVAAGPGNDVVTADGGNNTVFADEGDDRITLGKGNDIVFAGAGHDHVRGGAGNDRLFGEDGCDELYGEAGDDVLDGGAARDTVRGGAGNDRIIATKDAADDRYDGGEGRDTLDLSATERGVTVDLTRGKAIGIEIGSDTVIDFEAIIGGSGDDCLIVGEKPATLRGGQGDDGFVFAVESDDGNTGDLVHQILDLEVGDLIIVKQYRLRTRDDDDEDDRDGDDDFEQAYGDDNDERPFRFRFEKIGEDERTYVDVYVEREETKDFSIEIYGNHKLYYV